MKNTHLQAHILCKKGDIAPRVVLPGDPARVLRIAKLLDSYKEISFNREYRVVTGKYKGKSITICSSGIGGPSTAIAMEELIALGAKQFIRVGSCGGNNKKIKVGDLIISDSVIREDHTCLDYVSIKYPAIADPDLFYNMKTKAKELKYRFHTGLTITVDALYAEKTKETKLAWQKYNALAQDMEASTVLTLARLKNCKAGVVLLAVNQAGEKEIRKTISTYSVQAKNNKGSLVELEKRAAHLALESFI